eukprot:5814553-Amphidinium_carterae.1
MTNVATFSGSYCKCTLQPSPGKIASEPCTLYYSYVHSPLGKKQRHDTTSAADHPHATIVIGRGEDKGLGVTIKAGDHFPKKY